MRLQRIIGLAWCGGVITLCGPALAQDSSATPIHMEGYLDAAPSDATVDRVIVVGIAGKVRKLLITHETRQNPEDRSVQVGAKSNPAIVPVGRVGRAGSDARAMHTEKSAPDFETMSILGRSPDVDQLLNQAAGTHFAGDFSYAHGGTELRVEKIAK